MDLNDIEQLDSLISDTYKEYPNLLQYKDQKFNLFIALLTGIFNENRIGTKFCKEVQMLVDDLSENPNMVLIYKKYFWLDVVRFELEKNEFLVITKLNTLKKFIIFKKKYEFLLLTRSQTFPHQRADRTPIQNVSPVFFNSM